jgi:2'-5' RNA ligase
MPAPMAEQSAILVPVPEAEPVVSRHRARLDRAAVRGVPAHVTVLYPFVATPTITAATMAALADAVASVRAFDCQFPVTAWFGQDVLWLPPRPAGRFRALTRAVSAAFPGYLPYGGAYHYAVPHLTVGDRPAGEPRTCGPLKPNCCATCRSPRASAGCG